MIAGLGIDAQTERKTGIDTDCTFCEISLCFIMANCCLNLAIIELRCTMSKRKLSSHKYTTWRIFTWSRDSYMVVWHYARFIIQFVQL